MAVAAGARRHRVVERHRPWWRSRLGAASSQIVVAMVIAYFGWKGQFRVARLRSTWNSLARHLDDLQDWLFEQRNAAHPNIVFRDPQRLPSFLDDLVRWLDDVLLLLTWAGTTALGTLIVLRFGGGRAAIGVFGSFASFALRSGLWDESIADARADVRGSGLSLAIGMPLGVLAGRSDASTGDHARCSTRCRSSPRSRT